MIENTDKMGARFQSALKGLRSNIVKEVRGRGPMSAVELQAEAGGARRYCEALKDRGVLCKETHANTLPIAPPLVITPDEVDWAMEQFSAVLTQTRH